MIDTHVHFWDLEHLRYPWLDDIPSLNQSYLPVDYPEDHQILCVQAGCLPEQGLAEVDWFAELDAPVVGIVAHAPVERGIHVHSYLIELNARPHVCGVRRLLQTESATFAIQPDFIRGTQLLAEYDLTFDICVQHHQLPTAIELVRHCPAVTFILDHIGNPDVKSNRLDPWRHHIEQLAAFPNVACKLSGIITRASHTTWSAKQIAPYIEYAVALFGKERLLFGSDWPLVNQAGSLTGWQTTLSEITDIPAALFDSNARRIYALTDRAN